MIHIEQTPKYRRDIDGLRGIAVSAVLLFHFGYLPNGYLGVDIFFVISGFLITGIINREMRENRFSIVNFYLRRTRRIIPLALVSCLVALLLGIYAMLPDDLENLAQSVIATNVFSNNILLEMTIKDYWDVRNEYKPLMHTWSLGVEEQYYMLYPFLLFLVSRKKPAYLLPVISGLSLVSLALYLFPYYESHQKFYLIYFRFWELAAGGIVAILLQDNLIVHRFSALLIAGVVAILASGVVLICSEITLLAVVLMSAGIIASLNTSGTLSSAILENAVLVAAGKISFSLYMWHQILLAFARYCIAQELGPFYLGLIFVLTVIISVGSYAFIEQPFRNKQVISTKVLLITMGIAILITSSSSLYIYAKAGVLRDIPELGIKFSEAQRNLHAKYNSRVYAYDKEFANTDNVKILVIGASFARDWVNLLLESSHGSELEISYVFDPSNPSVERRARKADIVFYSAGPKSVVTPDDVRNAGLSGVRLWVVGTKNFGTSSGVFYNAGKDGYYEQRTNMQEGYLDRNEKMRSTWGKQYVDYIQKVIDRNGTMPVFTPTGQFISQDCMHFTKAGAQFFAKLFDRELGELLTAR
jgi:peptidoglycan/LPS O-acetylase OafA/YrhL